MQCTDKRTLGRQLDELADSARTPINWLALLWIVPVALGIAAIAMILSNPKWLP